MKIPVLFLIFFTFVFSSSSQVWETYQISVKGDTINCVDMKQLKQGKWVVRVEPLRGEPGYEEEGIFVDDKKEGPWRKYNLTGDILGVENYRWGFRDGKQTYFTSLGDLLREESWRAVNPENPYDTIEVPDLNNPMVMQEKIIKHESSELRHGSWKYYNPSTGMITKTENYNYGMKLDALGRPIAEGTPANNSTTTTSAKPAAKPAAVEEWEKKNSGKKKVTVRDGRTGG
jgi:hypothetical protein